MIAPAAPFRRDQSLDVLRACAILLVFFSHFEFPAPAAGEAWILWLARGIHRGGWVGVDLFFILSGFLVGGLLIREWNRFGNIEIGRFLLRRAFKIYPPFWAFVGVAATLLFVYGQPAQWHEVAVELLFLQNYLQGLPGQGHTWSLAVEEHFYLLLPILMWWALRDDRRPRRRLIRAVLICTSVVLALRILTQVLIPEYAWRTHYSPTHLRLDALLIGVLVAALYQMSPSRLSNLARRYGRFGLVVGVLLLGLVFLIPLESPYMLTLGFLVNSIAASCVLTGSLFARWKPQWLVNGLAWMGRQSYSVYLFHFVVFKVVDNAGPKAHLTEWYTRLPVAFVAAILAGWIATRLIEGPALQLRDRLVPSRAGNPLIN